MWRYVGGMVDGRTAREVYDARIAELEADDAQDEARKEEELIVLRRSQFRVVRPGSHGRTRRRSRNRSRQPSRPGHRLPTIVLAEREEFNSVSSWQTYLVASLNRNRTITLTAKVRSEGRWQLRHRARYIRSGERFLRELAVCEAATGLTFDVESTIASLHKLAPQLAEALLRACDTTESRAPGE